MRELRTCDFCDGAAVGTFEIVPPELDPSEAEQRRVVLCRDCKALLGELLEPLLARAGVGSADGSNPDGAEPLGTTAGRATDGRRAGGGAPSAGSDVDTGDDGARASVDDTATAEDSMPSVVDSGSGDDGSASDAGPSVGTDEPGGITIGADGDDPDAPDDGSKAADDGLASTATATGTETTSERPPRAYSNVLRLLRNREFPMARADVEALAAGAYDLENHEVEAVIDHAIEQGELVEDGRNLRRA